MENKQAARIATVEDDLAATVAKLTATEKELIEAGTTENSQAGRIPALVAELAKTVAKLTTTQAHLAGHEGHTAGSQGHGDPSIEQRPGSEHNGNDITGVTGDDEGTSPAFGRVQPGGSLVGNTEGSGTPPGIHRSDSLTSCAAEDQPGSNKPQSSGPTGSGSAHDTSSPPRSEGASRSGDESGGASFFADSGVQRAATGPSSHGSCSRDYFWCWGTGKLALYRLRWQTSCRSSKFVSYRVDRLKR